MLLINIDGASCAANRLTFYKIISVALFILTAGSPNAETPVAQRLYQTHCAECHHAMRQGGVGPVLLPESLKYLRKNSAIKAIRSGHTETLKKDFSSKLSDEQVNALVDYIYSPQQKSLSWSMGNIRSSHVVYDKEKRLLKKPALKVKDPQNVFVVVEKGDHHVTLLDGDTFEPLHRFKSRFALLGDPQFSPSGRYVYFSSRDGWISKYDLLSLNWVAEIRVGINTRNMAISSDGRYLLAANFLPHTLVLLDSRTLSPLKYYPVKTIAGKSSRVSAVYTSPPSNSFFAALKDIPELWEISYADEPPHGFGMWMHDYRVDSGENTRPVPFPFRRIPVKDYLDDLFFANNYISIVGVTHAASGQVVDMDVRKPIVAKLDLAGKPHFSSGVSFTYQGQKVLAVPNFRKGVVSVINLETWETIKQIKTLGPGFYIHTHKNSPYIWTDVFFGPHKDAVHVIDKASLEIVKTLRPMKGKKSAHVEFSRDGKHALVSIWEKEGALIVYDAKTLKEIKRIPMKKPAGKYNIYNRVN